jgi:CheY-like chemotaxis protein
MLAFARRQTLETHPIDLQDLVRDMVELLQRTLGPSVAIETRFPLALPYVLADSNQLEMALLNLCVNARDAMPEGGSIIISGRENVVGPGHETGLPEGRYISLAVKDHGAGMDPEVLARATEPFFTTKGVGKGTGLGLPMVHGVAEQSNGRFILRSVKGSGTTAEIWLPAAERALRAEPAPAVRPAPGPALRILAVDDDPLVLFNTAAMLTDLGHDVVEASTGRGALQAFEPGAFDLVITDQAMPGMTGLQLARELRARQAGLKIILATGYAEMPSDARVDFPMLKKPFQQVDLQTIVDATAARK